MKPALHHLLIILITLTSATAVHAEEQNTRLLSVRGEAELHFPADQVELDIGVITQASSAIKATSENANIMQKLEKALIKLGIQQQEYETEQFQVQPNWSLPTQNNNPNGYPTITSYSVTNKFHIKTTKIDRVADIIKTGAEAGANAIDSIIFNLASPAAYKDQAIKLATENAMHTARILAASAALQLDNIASINLDDASLAPVYRGAIRFKNEMQFADSNNSLSTPISSGQVTIRSNVSLVYHIK